MYHSSSFLRSPVWGAAMLNHGLDRCPWGSHRSGTWQWTIGGLSVLHQFHSSCPGPPGSQCPPSLWAWDHSPSDSTPVLRASWGQGPEHSQSICGRATSRPPYSNKAFSCLFFLQCTSHWGGPLPLQPRKQLPPHCSWTGGPSHWDALKPSTLANFSHCYLQGRQGESFHAFLVRVF